MLTLDVLESYQCACTDALRDLSFEIVAAATGVLGECSTVNGAGAFTLLDDVVVRWSGGRELSAVDSERVAAALEAGRRAARPESGVANAFGVFLATLSTMSCRTCR
jgi:hypothetical protein